MGERRFYGLALVDGELQTTTATASANVPAPAPASCYDWNMQVRLRRSVKSGNYGGVPGLSVCQCTAEVV